MRNYYYPIVISMLLTLFGCTTLSGVGSDNAPTPSPLVKFSPEKKLNTIWKARVGSGANKTHVRFETAVHNGAIYTVDEKGAVSAINAANGKTIWTANIKSCPSSGPDTQSGYLIFGTKNGEVIALNSHNGHLVWRSIISSQLLAPPRIANQLVLVKAVDGKLTALDITTGKPLWDFTHRTPLVMLQRDSAPVVARGVVFAGFGDGQFFALSLQTGKVLWQQTIALPRSLGDLDSLVGINADPLINNSVVFVAAYQGKLAALSTSTGQIIWQRDLSTYHNFALQGNLIVVTDDQGIVWAINRVNGQVQWLQKALLNRSLTAPLIEKQEIWIGDSEGNLHVLSTKDGHFIARCLIDSSGLFVQPVFDKNGVIVRSAGGELAKTCLTT